LYEQSEPVLVREHDRRPVLGRDVPAQVAGYAAVGLPGDRIGVVRVVDFRHQLDRQRCADCTSREDFLVVLDTDQLLRSVGPK
jgi:hypothetical protein